MKKINLPKFTGYRPKKCVLAQFIFDYELEGIKDSRRFRRQLARVLENVNK